MLRRFLPACLTLSVLAFAAVSAHATGKIEVGGSSTPSQAEASAQAAPEQSFTALELQTEQDIPGACLVFAASIDEAQRETLSSLVKVEPAQDDIALKLNDNRICLEGLAFGGKYTVTVNPGLTGSGYAPTSAAIVQTIELPARAPSLAFRSSGYILPRVGAEGIPLRSVNISKARISIYRINDRNLIDQLSNSMLGAQLAQYNLSTIENQSGEKVYTGTLSIQRDGNKWVNTLIPVADALKERKPGIYIAIAENADEGAPEQQYWSDRATQWFVISDIALSAFQSPNDGMAVVARTLSTGAGAGNITLTLLAQNNTELGRVKTDANGIARFAPGLLRGTGGNMPRAIYALNKDNGDFSFIDIAGAAIDLTDRGVAGRYASGPMDAYVVTERGIYRPGETVYATALLRDAQLKAITGLPLTLKVLRPDGKEAETRTLNEVADGGYSFTYTSNVSDQGGMWSLQLYTDVKLAPIGSTTFLLEDFQPPRLEVDLKPDLTAIAADGTGRVAVDARFLYGAPAGGLRAGGAVSVKYASQPFAQYKDYQFGQVEEKFLPVRAELPEFTLDEQGHSLIDLALGTLPDTSHPLEATLNVNVYDVGGRPVNESISLPVQNHDSFIGVKATAYSFAENTEAAFDVVMLDGATGAPKAAQGIVWNLYSEQYDYIWYRSGSSWNYEPTITSSRVGSGTVDMAETGAKRLNVNVQSGYYRLELRTADGKTITSTRFTAGWRANPNAVDKPDAATITRSDESVVKPGARITFNIKPPYDAEVTLVSADTRLRDVATESIPAAGKDVTLRVPDDAAGGFYLLVSAVQKRTENKNTPPRRAMGVLWVPLDPTPNQLALTLTAPELARPNTTVNVDLKAEGMGSQNVHVVLAAVDDGVLGMTDYQSPNPSGWFLSQRWLGLSVYDVYGNLIDSSNALRGELREGGDSGAARQMKGLPQQITRIAAIYSGIVTMENGKASIPLALPDFNGRLRLMAFAWTATRTGQTDATMLVRAPLVAELMLPRFLAPGDVAQVALSVDNRDAPKGAYQVSLTATGPVTLEGGSTSVELDAGQRKSVPLRLTAGTVGEATFNLEVKGPENYSLTRSFNISVRAGNPTITRRVVSMLPGGQSNTIKPDLLQDLLPGTVEMSLAYSSLPEFDVPNLLKNITRYPYGCAEQTTSTAMPLLYLNQVSSALGLGQDAALRGRVQNALDKLAAMQRKDGGFGIWSAADNYEVWLTSYITDFMSRAQSLSYKVSNNVLDGLYSRLQLTLKDSYVQERDLAARSYAIYMLARAGKVDAADVRYFYDTWFNKLTTRLARTQIAAALKLVGDEQRSTAATARINGPRTWEANYAYDYGSDLRDDAAVITLLAEHKLEAAGDVLALSTDLARVRTGRYWLSTQEMSWMLLAANALMKDRDSTLNLTVGHDAVQQSKPYYRTLPEGSSELMVKNNAEKDVFQTITMSGVPTTPQPAEANDFTLTREFYKPDGTRTTLEGVKQNDLIVVVLSGRSHANATQQVMLVDMLPAGFELENTRIAGNASTLGSLGWLGDNLTVADNTEFRSDRFVAALNMGPFYYSSSYDFRIAYVMRAVTPGTFSLPGSYVEDMYQPARHARTESGMVTISAAQ